MVYTGDYSQWAVALWWSDPWSWCSRGNHPCYWDFLIFIIVQVRKRRENLLGNFASHHTSGQTDQAVQRTCSSHPSPQWRLASCVHEFEHLGLCLLFTEKWWQNFFSVIYSRWHLVWTRFLQNTLSGKRIRQTCSCKIIVSFARAYPWNTEPMSPSWNTTLCT